jgi:hypothetical protein
MTEIEIAYRVLASFLSTHFMGEPQAEDLRALIRDAQKFRDDMNRAIERAIAALAEPDK